MTTGNFRCPYCDAFQTVTEQKYAEHTVSFNIGSNAYGAPVGSTQTVICCSNPVCQQLTIMFSLRYFFQPMHQLVPDNRKTAILHKRIMPASIARVLPDYIPRPLREDYEEACLIKDLSPKAAATLARRCLQGMIRDFCKIAEKTLNNEITKLRSAVDTGCSPAGVSPESVDAIDHVRRVGNIGAHMEKDINNIVEVSADEAQVLIDLLESLFEEWYVARERRRLRFEAVKAVAEDKKDVIEGFSKPALAKPSS